LKSAHGYLAPTLLCPRKIPHWYVLHRVTPKTPQATTAPRTFTAPGYDRRRASKENDTVQSLAKSASLITISSSFHNRRRASKENDTVQSLAKSASLITISSSFHILFRVLFTFPSQYFCAIGLVTVFSFGWDQPPVLGLQSQTTRLGETQTPAYIGTGTGLSPSVVHPSRWLPISNYRRWLRI